MLGLAGTGVPFVYRTIGDPSYWVRPSWRRRAVGLILRRAARNDVRWPSAGDHPFLPSLSEGMPGHATAVRFMGEMDDADNHDRIQGDADG